MIIGVGTIIIPIYRGGYSLPGYRAQDDQAVEPELKLTSAHWKIVITHWPFGPHAKGAAPRWRPTDVSIPVLLLGLHQSPGSWAAGIVDGIEDPLEALPRSDDTTRSPCGYIMPQPELIKYLVALLHTSCILGTMPPVTHIFLLCVFITQEH